MSLQEQLEELKSQTLAKIESAKELSAVETIRVETLGKKGPITEVLRGMRDLSAEERPKVGAFANEIRDMLTSAVEKRKSELTELALEKAVRRSFRCDFTRKASSSWFASRTDSNYGGDRRYIYWNGLSSN